MEISRCKFCQSEGFITDVLNEKEVYVRCGNPNCGCNGPVRNHNKEQDAIVAWNDMMSTPTTPSIDYRDRVDRMVAAAFNGYVSNPAIQSPWSDKNAIREAMETIDAIDAAIKERENPK